MQLTDQLLVLSGAILGIVGLFSYRLIKTLYVVLKLRRKMSKGYLDKRKELEEFKKSGEMHKWVNNVPVRTPKGETIRTHVCEHTGYCPEIDSFVPTYLVKQIVQSRKTREEFEEFKKNEIKSIQQHYSIPDCDIDQLIEDVMAIETKFSNKKLQEFKEMMIEQLGDNVKIISDIEDIEEILDNGKSKKIS